MPDFKTRPSVNGVPVLTASDAAGRNLLGNSSFESGGTGYANFGGGVGRAANSEVVFDGSLSLQIEAQAGNTGTVGVFGTGIHPPPGYGTGGNVNSIPCTPGEVYTASVYGRWVTGTPKKLGAGFIFWTANGTLIAWQGDPSPKQMSTTDWVRASSTRTVPAGAAFMAAVFYFAEVATGDAGVIDAAKLERGDVATAYVDQELVDGRAVFLRNAGIVMSGGGGKTTSGSTIRWGLRFIVLGAGRGRHASTDGFFDIAMPPNGTIITGVGGASAQTVAGGVIDLGTWDALYYILPVGRSSHSRPENFRLVRYVSDFVIPEDWVLVCQRNGDDASFLWGTGETTNKHVDAASLTVRGTTATVNGQPVALIEEVLSRRPNLIPDPLWARLPLPRTAGNLIALGNQVWSLTNIATASEVSEAVVNGELAITFSLPSHDIRLQPPHIRLDKTKTYTISYEFNRTDTNFTTSGQLLLRGGAGHVTSGDFTPPNTLTDLGGGWFRRTATITPANMDGTGDWLVFVVAWNWNQVRSGTIRYRNWMVHEGDAPQQWNSGAAVRDDYRLPSLDIPYRGPDTPPADWPTGISTMQVPVSGMTDGYPAGTAILVTEMINVNRMVQTLTLKSAAPVRSWQRTPNNAGDGWSAWREVVYSDDARLADGRQVTHLDFGAVTQASPPSAYPVGVSILRKNVNDASWPISAQYMTVTTYRNSISVNSSYQEAIEFWGGGATRRFYRQVLSQDTWGPWRQFVSDDDARLAEGRQITHLNTGAVAESSGPGSYPVGISIMRVNQNAWSISSRILTVTTFRSVFDMNYSYQEAVEIWGAASTRRFYRQPTGTNTWGPWQEGTGPKGDKGDKGDRGDAGPQGIQGLKGDTGATGATGPAGTPGSRWLTGSGVPAGATGVVGDWYFRTDNGWVYEKTGASVWTYRANITGPQGAQGAQGLQGPQGIQGPQGVQGVAGAAGSRWLQGTTVPAGSLGVVGDWYVRTTTSDVYEKTGASTWTLRVNIQGAQGLTGATGAQGPPGEPGAQMLVGGSRTEASPYTDYPLGMSIMRVDAGSPGWPVSSRYLVVVTHREATGYGAQEIYEWWTPSPRRWWRSSSGADAWSRWSEVGNQFGAVAEKTSDTVNNSATETAIMSLVVPEPGSYKLQLAGTGIAQSAVADRFAVAIKVGSNFLGQAIGSAGAWPVNVVAFYGQTTASFTVTATLRRISGSGSATLAATTNVPLRLWAERVG